MQQLLNQCLQQVQLGIATTLQHRSFEACQKILSCRSVSPFWAFLSPPLGQMSGQAEVRRDAVELLGQVKLLRLLLGLGINDHTEAHSWRRTCPIGHHTHPVSKFPHCTRSNFFKITFWQTLWPNPLIAK